MVMLNKEYMINHMRNENGSINIKNVVLAAACEATELFQCLIVMDSNFTDWSRFVDRLEKNVERQDYEKELEGLYLVRDDAELCSLYYQIFVGMLDLTVFSTEAMVDLNGGKHDE